MSDFIVSNDVDGLLRQSSKENIKTYLEIPQNNNLATIVQSNSGYWVKSVVTVSEIGVGNTVTLSANCDETFFLNSSSTAPLSSFFIKLPSYSDSYVGQTKTIVSSKDISVATVSVTDSDVILGNVLTFLPAYNPKAYQCISKTPTYATWLRLA